MERLFTIIVICFCRSIVELSGQAVESPQYRVVQSESDFEVRLYRESSWMSAQVRETTSFEKAIFDGFHRLYQYIHSENLNSPQINITAPVVTSSVPYVHGQEYYLRLYVPSKYERTPQPFPEQNLQFDKRSRCIAARKFTGFATDDGIDELDTLVSSLNGKPGILKEKSAYAIAQYNGSHHVSGRLNEVWMDLSGFTIDC